MALWQKLGDASSGQAVQEAAYSLFDFRWIFTSKPIKKAVRDESLYIGRRYFKYHAAIPTLTAIPETGHTNSPRPRAGSALYHRAGWLQAAV
jgi:hypothetical protein